MARTFRDIAPTLSKRSRLNLTLPIRSADAGDAVVIPSDPRFDARAGSYPMPGTPGSGAPEAAIGGSQDGRIYQAGGYPVAKRGSIIGTPGAGTHSLGNWQSDNAIDVGIPNGVPILATGNGVVEKVHMRTLDPSSRFAGYQVTLRTADNRWFYTHMSRIPKGLKAGTKVKKGQVIGYNGSANGVPHLHLGVQFGNPLELLGLKK